jgi:hypothetical protein
VPGEIVFRFGDEGVAASARLLDEAPETCRAVLAALPISGLARHELIRPPREHATTIVRPGDVGFLTVEEGAKRIEIVSGE